MSTTSETPSLDTTSASSLSSTSVGWIRERAGLLELRETDGENEDGDVFILTPANQRELLNFLLSRLDVTDPPPIPMQIICPRCSEQHVDEGAYATIPHKSHTCQECGLTWKPALVPTVGVKFLPGTRNATLEG